MSRSSTGAFWTSAFLALCVVSGAALFGISQRLYTRIDLTKERRFTLSETTTNLLSQLTSPLEVRVYRTQNLQSPLLDSAQALLDTLEEYRRHSGGRLNLAVADPTDESLSKDERDLLQKEAQGFGIQQVDATFQEDDKAEKRRIYLGVSLAYSGRQEVLPFVGSPATLEYDLTRLLKRLITGGETTKPVIGFVSGHGEPNVAGQLTQVFGDDREYRTLQLNQPVPDEIDALIIITAPKGQNPALFTEAEQYYLDQFLMSGRAVIVFLSTLAKFEQNNSMPGQQELPIYQPAQTGLEEILANYGIKTTGDTVLDPKYNLPVQVGSRKVNMGGFTMMEPVQANHPLYLIANDLSKESPLVKGFAQLVLPQVTGLNVEDAVSKGFTVEELVKSSEASFRRPAQSGLLIAEPNQLSTPAEGDIPGPALLVAAITGSFPSFFAGKPVPDLTPKQQPNQPPQSAPTSIPAKLDAAQEGARLLVVGTGVPYFQAGRNPQNLLFFQNLLDWSVLDTDMMEIRSRSAADPALKEIEPGTQSLLKWLNILGLPFALALFGIVRWQLRKKKSEKSQ